MAKYHIDKNGMPAICKAKERPCPLGGDDVHFDSFEEANVYAQQRLEEQYGILGGDEEKSPPKLTGIELKKAREKKINDMVKDLRARHNHNPGNYINRCRSSEKVSRLWIRGKTIHAVDDREEKEKRLISMYGEGNYVGDYKVFHKVGSMHAPKYQYTRIYDNGRIVMYDYHTKEKITTFMAHETRIAGVMLLAGEIPDDDMLQKIKENYRKESEVQESLPDEKRNFKGKKRRNNKRGNRRYYNKRNNRNRRHGRRY